MRSALEWYGNPVLDVMLLDHDEPTTYEEEMMSLDSAKWFDDAGTTDEVKPNFRTPPS